MKAFKVNRHTVAALVSLDELGNDTMSHIARKAFSTLGEPAPQSFDITAYMKENSILVFAAEKRKKCFDMTKHYHNCRQ